MVLADNAAGLAAGLAQGPNTLVIAEGGDGVIDVTTLGGLLMQHDQTLQGGGSTIRVAGVQSGTEADFTAPGSRPTIR